MFNRETIPTLLGIVLAVILLAWLLGMVEN